MYLVDTNVLIDYLENEESARSFFKMVFDKGLEVGILKDVYIEAKTIRGFEFSKIERLIGELIKYGLYFDLEATSEELRYVEFLRTISKREVGETLDWADLVLLSVAKFRELEIVSKDRLLKELAKLEGVKAV